MRSFHDLAFAAAAVSRGVDGVAFVAGLMAIGVVIGAFALRRAFAARSAQGVAA